MKGAEQLRHAASAACARTCSRMISLVLASASSPLPLLKRLATGAEAARLLLLLLLT